MQKNSKEMTEKNKVDVSPLDNIRQEKRIELIINDIVAGLSRLRIIDKYTELWECGKRTINAIYNEALITLSDEVRASKEQTRAISNIRLEGVWDECATVNQKLKTIDMINKTNNVYDNNVVVSAGEDGFQFDIGVEVKDPVVYDDLESNDQE